MRLRTHPLALAAAVAAAGLFLTGCELPEGGGGAGSEVFGTGTSTRGHVVGRDAAGDPVFADPRDNELYDQMNRPLPYSGGDIDGPCGAWQAATPQLAAKHRDAHQRCLSGETDLTGAVEPLLEGPDN